jgi:hypothetical protein
MEILEQPSEGNAKYPNEGNAKNRENVLYLLRRQLIAVRILGRRAAQMSIA